MTTNLKSFFKSFVLVAGLLLASVSAQASSIDSEIPNFKQVNQNIYRGGRPSAEGLLELQKLGIKTIINLEDNRSAVKTEQKNLKSYPINFISIPTASLWSPKDKNVDHILNLLKDPNNFPIYIHCQHGQDRTGLMIGLYRVFDEGWKPVDAYQEMLANGFHQILFMLNRYFEHKTNFED